MNYLDKTIEFYLKSATNYAFMITGSWSSGKTYYLKNQIRKIIEATPTISNNSKKYKAIIVSLFGLKNVEDIQLQIFLSLYPFLNNKAFKLSTGIAKSIIKGISKVSGSEDFYNIIGKTELYKPALIRFNEIVLCFDDLERISADADIKEVIGYINILVESEGAKVLIIANESEIPSASFNNLREKVIGSSIEFKPDIYEVYQSIVLNKFNGYPSYKDFLLSKKQFILNIFGKDKINLRTLTYSLIYFHEIYSNITNDIPLTSILKVKENEVINNLLRFTLAVSIEYKKGELRYEHRRNIDYNTAIEDYKLIDWLESRAGNDGQEDASKDNYREKFIKSYFDNNYYYYESAYDFITGGTYLNIEKLISELDKQYHIDNNEVPEHYQVLNQLNHVNALSHSDEQYKSLLKKMLSFIDKGEYDIHDSLNLFIYALRFKNPLNLNPTRLENRIIKNIRKKIHSSRHDPMLEIKIGIMSNSLYYEHLDKIRCVALEVNNKLGQNEIRNYALELESTLYNSFDKFIDKLRENNSNFEKVPFLKYFNPNKLYSHFLNITGDERSLIINFIELRYNDLNSHILSEELVFLKSLYKKLSSKHKAMKNSGPTHFLFTKLILELKASIDKLEPYFKEKD